MNLDSKVLVIGDPDIGKREFLKSIPDVEFPYEDGIIGVNLAKTQVRLNTEKDKTVNLMLWDIPGHPAFKMLYRYYFDGTNGIILAFDINRASSFSNIKNWFNIIVKHGFSGVPRILVGIKKSQKSAEERKIFLPTVKLLCKKLSAQYFEVSLDTEENVKLILQTIVKLIYRNKIGIYQYGISNSNMKKKKISKNLQEQPIFALFAEKLMENIKNFNEIKECPNCKSIIENKEKICPQCGTELKSKSFEENMAFIRSYLLDMSYTQNELIQVLGMEIKRMYRIIEENRLEKLFGIKKQKEIYRIMTEVPKIALNKNIRSFFLDILEIYLEKNRDEK